MTKLLKTLSGAALFAVLSFAPGASAAPLPCEEVCSCAEACSILCSNGSTRTNCGNYGICTDKCRAAPRVSTNTQEADDASKQVCSEKQEKAAAEQTAKTVKS
ncbi:hypothetical protein [Cystobacter ferrugineus]|uniref:Uncharacterized protein n=1 Tax=Cystobacter ferrugineus TaxID=83449 RepID=A0A1L9BKG3_9BACT|nr:hypothetical protein [Cystobacter ferrugineus]OJH42695.1 hypothetical protein BON30_05815 [Cystobacter ferrugineus]